MRTLANGTAIIIGEDDTLYRGRWVVRLSTTRVVMELDYLGETHEFEPEFNVVVAAGYDCYARAVLARVVAERQSAENELLGLFGTFG